MNLMLLSDLHLAYDNPAGRLDEVHKTCYGKMDFVLRYAEEHEATILQAGDFFDKPRSWHLLVTYIRLLDIYGIPVYCVFGQHDQYLRSRKDTLLDALSAAGYVTVLGKEPTVLEDKYRRKVHIYGSGYGEDVPVPTVSSDCDILVAHKMIVAKKLWPGQEDYTLAGRFLKKHGDFDLILCGDAHSLQRFEVGEDQADERSKIICNTGPLFRRSVDLWNHKPGFWIYDTKDWTMEWVEVPYEPAEEVLSRKHIEEKEEADAMLGEFVKSIESRMLAAEYEARTGGLVREEDIMKNEGIDFRNALDKFLKENQIEPEVMDVISEMMNEAGGSE